MTHAKKRFANARCCAISRAFRFRVRIYALRDAVGRLVDIRNRLRALSHARMYFAVHNLYTYMILYYRRGSWVAYEMERVSLFKCQTKIFWKNIFCVCAHVIENKDL